MKDVLFTSADGWAVCGNTATHLQSGSVLRGYMGDEHYFYADTVIDGVQWEVTISRYNNSEAVWWRPDSR